MTMPHNTVPSNHVYGDGQQSFLTCREVDHRADSSFVCIYRHIDFVVKDACWLQSGNSANRHMLLEVKIE